MSPRSPSLLVALASVFLFGVSNARAASSCDTMAPCAAKACRIDANLAQATTRGDTKAQASLERSKREVVRCNDDGLRQERKVALEQAQRRIDQRTQELKQVQAGGNTAKIKKAEQKLESARKTYADLQTAPL